MWRLLLLPALLHDPKAVAWLTQSNIWHAPGGFGSVTTPWSKPAWQEGVPDAPGSIWAMDEKLRSAPLSHSVGLGSVTTNAREFFPPFLVWMGGHRIFPSVKG